MIGGNKKEIAMFIKFLKENVGVVVAVALILALVVGICWAMWYAQNHREALLRLDVRAIASGGMISHDGIDTFRSYGDQNYTKTPFFWFKNEGPDRVNVNIDFVDGDGTSTSGLVNLGPGEEYRVEHVFRYKKWSCRVVPIKP